MTLHRHELIDRLVAERNGAVVITGPGASSGMLWKAGHEPATIYNMEFGYATSVALGVALAKPDKRVMAVEGDGSWIAGLPTVATVARYAPPNLTMVVLDNGVYGTGGGRVATATQGGFRIAAVGIAAGLQPSRVLEVSTAPEAQEAFETVSHKEGPWLVVAAISTADAGSGNRRQHPEVDVFETAMAFRRSMTS